MFREFGLINQPVKVVQRVLGVGADWFLVLKTGMCLSNKTLSAQLQLGAIFCLSRQSKRVVALVKVGAKSSYPACLSVP